MYEDDDLVSENEHFISFIVGRMIPNPNHRWKKCCRTKVRIPTFTIGPYYKISDRLSLPFEGTLQSFQDFLRSEFSDENVEFWLACQDYRSSSSADELRSKARSIYEKFIQPTACREVSLADSCLVWVQKRQKNTFLCDRMLHSCICWCSEPFKFWEITKQTEKSERSQSECDEILPAWTQPEHVVALFSHFWSLLSEACWCLAWINKCLYLASGFLLQINVDQHIREEIRKSLEKPSVCCFNEAQKHIYMLMERDSCPRFLLSDAYLRLAHKSKTLWYI